jgi:Nuclear protein 96
MTGRQIDEACSHAISNGDLRMALLISQAMGSDEIRQLMRHQLDGWAQTEVCGVTLCRKNIEFVD